MGRRKKLLIAILVGIVWFIWQGFCGSRDAKDEVARVLYDRPWLERLPDDGRQKVHGLLLVGDKRQPFGIAGYGSAFQQELDVVQHQREEGRLTLVFLQEETKVVFGLKAWRCGKEGAPRGFDLCLELDRAGKRLRLYSSESWAMLKKGLDEPRATALLDAASRVDALGELPACDDCPEGTPTWLEAN